MATYDYKARDEGGKLLSGTLEGSSREEVAQKLRKMGYMPTGIREIMTGMTLEDIGERFRGIKVEDIIIFNVQLANMIDSGLSILSSLQAIENQLENKKLRRIIGEVRRSIEGGSTFSGALEKHGDVFSKLFVSTVKAGEASGNLNVVLNRLAVYVEQQNDLRQKVKNALFYPAVLLVTGLAVIVIIVTFVMPQFVEIFRDAHVPLPLPTIILYNFGIILKKFWYLIVFAVFLCTIAIKTYARTQAGRLRFDRWKLNAPVTGPLVRKVVISRFSRTLATLLGSGVPVLQALDIMRDVVGNEVFARVIAHVRESVEDGQPLAQPLKVSEEFPADTVQMVAIGEQTGKLDHMLNKNADFYDTAVEYSIKKITTLIEPAFIILMGIVVGFIMASMLLPIFDMIKTMRH